MDHKKAWKIFNDNPSLNLLKPIGKKIKKSSAYAQILTKDNNNTPFNTSVIIPDKTQHAENHNDLSKECNSTKT